MQTDDGCWVKYEDYARLKAECQARQAENSVLAVECDSLKAEVERLEDFNDGLMAMRWQDEKGNLLTASDYNRLKAEVERLTKAGDAMAKIIKGPAHGPGEWDGEWDNWQEAKKGGQP
jgi:chromosome condensin MukBEF complex kleisin-like MukF subunit